ncbi:BTB/POZ/MATH-domain protein [Rhynchospora pubera]|uniref:BTB/POZ/MATH-domain protein n=1 Tax=Rhynchospora pubera TaxID=906938 RepID=A0AAV8FMM1_9POAL|nr:BTB/POZ/MATH-domain protein [Rhynchospora pubera]
MAMMSSAVDIIEPETITTWLTKTCTGSHLFKITGYSFNKGIGVGKCINSDIFTVGGYNWTIGYYPDGKSRNNTEPDWLAFDLHLTSAARARVKITLTMLNQFGGTPLMHNSGAVTVEPYCSSNFPYFIKRKEFETSNYLKNDSFTIRGTVTVMKSKKHPFTVQPSNLHQQLTGLLESEDGTDVSFKVRGVTFNAHCCVLAARSPVFRAQFFGPMKGLMNESIEIKDMEPSIFKSMLHFIYSDSVPELQEVSDDKDVSIVLAQHLLVAADRYGLDRLKQICEMKMYEFIDAHNFGTTLTLAEQHNCSELKAACMEFIKPPEMLAAVVRTEGFEHMIKSCPGILKELRSKNQGC